MGVLKAKDLGGNWVPIGIGAGQADVESGTYTPTLTNITSPTSNEGWFTFVGGANQGDTGILYINGKIVLSAALAGGPTITIPNQFRWHGFVSGNMCLGQAVMDDVSATAVVGVVRQWSANTILISNYKVDGVYPALQSVNATQPFAWAAGDIIYWFCQAAAYRL